MGPTSTTASPTTFFHDPFPGDPLTVSRLPSSVRLHILTFHLQTFYLDLLSLLDFYGRMDSATLSSSPPSSPPSSPETETDPSAPPPPPVLIFRHIKLKRAPPGHRVNEQPFYGGPPENFSVSSLLSELPNGLCSIDSPFFWEGLGDGDGGDAGGETGRKCEWGKEVVLGSGGGARVGVGAVHAKIRRLVFGVGMAQMSTKSVLWWEDFVLEKTRETLNEPEPVIFCDGVERLEVTLRYGESSGIAQDVISRFKLRHNMLDLESYFCDVRGENLREASWSIDGFPWLPLVEKGISGLQIRTLCAAAKETVDGDGDDEESPVPKEEDVLDIKLRDLGLDDYVRDWVIELKELESEGLAPNAVESLARILDLYEGAAGLGTSFGLLFQSRFRSLELTLCRLFWNQLPFYPIQHLVENSHVLKTLLLGGITLTDPTCSKSIAASTSLEVVHIFNDEKFRWFQCALLFRSKSIQKLALEGFAQHCFEDELSEQSVLRTLEMTNCELLPHLRRFAECLVGLKTVKLLNISSSFEEEIVECFVETVDRSDFVLQIDFDAGYQHALKIPFLIVTPYWRSTDLLLTNIGQEIPYHVILDVFEFLEVGLFLPGDNVPESFGEDGVYVRDPVELFGRFRYDVTRKVFLIFTSVTVRTRNGLLALPDCVRHVRVLRGDTPFPFFPPKCPTFLLSVDAHIMTSFDWLDRAEPVERLATRVQRLTPQAVACMSRHSLRALKLTVNENQNDDEDLDELQIFKLDCQDLVSLAFVGGMGKDHPTRLSHISVYCPHLTSLSLSSVHMDDDFGILGGVHLRTLSVKDCVCAGTDIYLLLDLGTLETLSVEGNGLDLSRVVPPETFTTRDIRVKNSDSVAAFLPLIERCPLRTLHLINCGISDQLRLPIVECFRNSRWRDGVQVRFDDNDDLTDGLVRDMKDACPRSRIFWKGSRHYGSIGGGGCLLM